MNHLEDDHHNHTQYDCQRGCSLQRSSMGELNCKMTNSCCKLSTYDWMTGLSTSETDALFEIRFKNTHKGFFINSSGVVLHKGDIVAVEAATGHDIGIISMEGPVVMRQLIRHGVDPKTYEYKKIYRKAKTFDLEKWQEAIGREHQTMIRSRQIASSLALNMKIGDVEFQGDGTKATFYYIADDRVDFRQLIKLFAEEFKIRIEMRQIGARQEAGRIGGLGVCGQELCCSRWMIDFRSITTQAARSQDLSLNPQKLAGQCGKLKCCINYEAAVYIDAQKNLPQVHQPLDTEEGPAYLVKTDILRGLMWFSYDPQSLSRFVILPAAKVKEFIQMNSKGIKLPSLSVGGGGANEESEFKSAVGEGSLTRFDSISRKKEGGRRHKNKNHRQPSRD
ncbi:MAG: hypothetical protein FWG54_05030 [Bacteroidetes bacterium]|nr:hypothetical protein [Bacteroidota bacterium]